MPLPAALRPYLQTPIIRAIASTELGTPIRVPVPFGGTLARILIRLTGTLTVTVAAATSVNEDAPYGLIRDCQVVVNGGKTIRAHPARFVQRWNQIQLGTGKRVTAPSGSVGSTAFVAEWEIDFSQYDLKGLEHYFVQDTRVTTGLDLIFQVGDANDIALAGGATLALSALQLSIQPEEIAGLGGYASEMQFQRLPRVISSVGHLVINDLPALGEIYRAFVLHTTSHATITDPIRQPGDDTIIGDVTLRGGVRTHYSATPWEQIRADNKGIFGIETMFAGWAVLDFARLHDLTQLLRTRSTRQLTLDLNIAAAPANANLEIYPIATRLLVG